MQSTHTSSGFCQDAWGEEWGGRGDSRMVVFPEESPNAGLAAGVPSARRYNAKAVGSWNLDFVCTLVQWGYEIFIRGRLLSGCRLNPGFQVTIAAGSEWNVVKCRWAGWGRRGAFVPDPHNYPVLTVNLEWDSPMQPPSHLTFPHLCPCPLRSQLDLSLHLLEHGL